MVERRRNGNNGENGKGSERPRRGKVPYGTFPHTPEERGTAFLEKFKALTEGRRHDANLWQAYLEGRREQPPRSYKPPESSGESPQSDSE